MKKGFYTIITLSLFLCSCTGNRYIDATYQYKAEIHNHTYRMQITLDKEGGAVLQMLDKPIIEDLGDIRNLSRLEKGISCNYDRTESPDGYYIWRAHDNLYDVLALRLVSTICLADDGYVYYCYSIDSWDTDEDCGNLKRVGRYTRIK